MRESKMVGRLRQLTRLLSGDGGGGHGVLPVAIVADGGGSGLDSRVHRVHGVLPLGHLLHAAVGLLHWPGDREKRSVSKKRSEKRDTVALKSNALRR